MICHLYPEPTYFFISSEVPDLLYYSHIPASVIALIVGFFVLFHAPQQLQNRSLFLICLSFGFWTAVNLVLWTNVQSDILLFAWSLLGVFASFISIFSIYFIYAFIDKHDVSLRLKCIFAILLAPVLIFAPTALSLTGIDITSCDAFPYEGQIFKYYHASLGLIAIVWIGVLLFVRYRSAAEQMRKQLVLMGIGIESFLLLFFTMVYLASYLATIGVFKDSWLELYGLFGMIVFMVFIGVLMVRFRSFNVGLLSSQALIFSLAVLIASEFTFINAPTARILVAFTLILTITIGYILIRSVKREVSQREQIEKLALNLERANTRLEQLDKLKSEFVSIASHQLRSPLAAMRGYASMLSEGTYGKLPVKAKEVVGRIEESAKLMASSVEDYLNVSRIEAGQMKYNLTDFNLREQAEHITDDIRPIALKKNIMMIFRSDMKQKGVIHADIGKTEQILHNLINNSLKYTEQGTMTVVARDDVKAKKIYIDIIDTGIGMSEKTLHSIFQKFERGSNANTTNIHGTGLGLYTAAKLAEAMGGSISAHSEGEGKGSRFTLEMPLVS